MVEITCDVNQGRNHWGSGESGPPIWTDRPTFHMICSPRPSFENPGAATATVPTPSSTLTPSVARPDPPTFTAWLCPWCQGLCESRENAMWVILYRKISLIFR